MKHVVFYEVVYLLLVTVFDGFREPCYSFVMVPCSTYKKYFSTVFFFPWRCPPISVVSYLALVISLSFVCMQPSPFHELKKKKKKLNCRSWSLSSRHLAAWAWLWGDDREGARACVFGVLVICKHSGKYKTIEQTREVIIV